MKFPDFLNILLLRSLSLVPAHTQEYTIKGFTIYFPPEDLEDLEWIYRVIPIILQRPWPLKELLVRWPPKFPLFMADARHPLVTEHYLRLNSHKDITTALCTLNSSDPFRKSLERHLSSRGIRFPPHQDVFSTLRITNKYPEVNRPGPGWQSALDRINEILNCPAALANLQSLEVDINSRNSEQTATNTIVASSAGGVTAEVAVVSVLFARLLTLAPNLEKLSLQVQCSSRQFFERDFELMGVRFERIRHLRLGPFSEYMVRFAPNLEILESGEYYDCRYGSVFPGDPGVWLLEAVEALPGGMRNNITTFSFSPWGSLTTGHVKDIINAMPNLEELSLGGGLEGTEWAWDYSKLGLMKYMPGMEKVLQSYLAVISHLPNLRTLKLPSAYGLGLGLDNSPRCGNIYDGPGGSAYGRQESQQRAKTVELAARFALQEMPYLSGLAVGGDKALSLNATMSYSGVMGATPGPAKVPEVRWPWTGRMKEWTFEEWPLDKPGWW
ncbi:hypothetical protein V8F33_009502 [Rhypophila sp. PSN 637]